jgi:uncharacterized coiled-coil protein SlyX
LTLETKLAEQKTMMEILRDREVTEKVESILAVKNGLITEREKDIARLLQNIEMIKEKKAYEMKCAEEIANNVQMELRGNVSDRDVQLEELKAKFKKENKDNIEKHKIITDHLKTIDVLLF